MPEPPDTLSHHREFYPGTVSEKQRKEALAKVLRERKAQHDADHAERQRLFAEHHATFMEGFRDSISRDDRFTDKEKVRIIKESYDW